MSAQNATERISLRRAPRWYREAAYRGWCDAIARLPYPAEYDDWNRGQQLAYESLRQICANIRAAGLRVPWWNGSAALADGVEWVGGLAAAKLGDPLPPDWVEAA